MPLIYAIIMTFIFFVLIRYYAGGHIIGLLLIFHLCRHLAKHAKISGVWKIDKNILTSYLVFFGFVFFIVLLFPFFPLNLLNITWLIMFFILALIYSFLIALKK